MKFACLLKSKAFRNIYKKVRNHLIKLDMDVYEFKGKILPGTACIISFGGDGTFLKAMREAALYAIPVIGINLGKLGFLALHDVKSVFKTLDNFIKNKAEIKRRTLLEVTTDKEKFIAINDFVIKSSNSRMIEVELTIDDGFVNIIRGDGIIVSTPTGSTAYNLAAGGPIITPQLDVFVITPISPFTLSQRSIVIKKEAIIGLKVLTGKHIASVDGQIELKEKTFKITAFSKNGFVVVPQGYNYYRILREKLGWIK
ncbi:MAG: NAD(+)/NADH kinase [bacterium]|nr:NAD(+)/NADH kinase [bacterium]